MNRYSLLLVYPILCSLLAIGVVRGYSQVPATLPISSFNNLSDTQFVELRQKWQAVPTADLLKAAAAGDAAAQFFYWGRKFERERENSGQGYTQMMAAAQGLTQQQRVDAEAKWNTASDAERSNAVAAGNMGAQMVAGHLTEMRSAERAVKDFEWGKKAAEQGLPPAEYDVARAYLRELNWVVIDLNQHEGVKFLKRAADHGWAPAQYKLGMQYVTGELTPPDLPKAVDLLRKAADPGGPRSKYELAQLYAAGIGEPRSTEDTPVALLRQSATNGYGPSLHALAERYRVGLGVPVDYIQSIRYYQAAREASQRAGTDPIDSYGDIFGLVDEKLQPQPDTGPNWAAFAKTLSIYLKATERSDADAMSQLGEGYSAGRFVPQDNVAAYYWFDRAANLGVRTAAEKRDAIRAKLRPEQLEQAATINLLGP